MIAKLKHIYILGYSGSHLSLIFETLTQLRYIGRVYIIMHDDIRYFDAPFKTTLNYYIENKEYLDNVLPENLFFCSNNPANKLFLFSFFQIRNKISEDKFISIIHPSSIIASTVQSKGGVYIEPLSVVSPYTKIGFGVSINRNCSVGHHNVLHDFCSLYPGSNLTGDVEVGRASVIGAGSTVFPGVKIGANTVIGGWSVVTNDIPSNVLAYGNPCQVVKPMIWDQNQTGII